MKSLIFAIKSHARTGENGRLGQIAAFHAVVDIVLEHERVQLKELVHRVSRLSRTQCNVTLMRVLFGPIGVNGPRAQRHAARVNEPKLGLVNAALAVWASLKILSHVY